MVEAGTIKATCLDRIMKGNRVTELKVSYYDSEGKLSEPKLITIKDAKRDIMTGKLELDNYKLSASGSLIARKTDDKPEQRQRLMRKPVKKSAQYQQDIWYRRNCNNLIRFNKLLHHILQLLSLDFKPSCLDKSGSEVIYSQDIGDTIEKVHAILNYGTVSIALLKNNTEVFNVKGYIENYHRIYRLFRDKYLKYKERHKKHTVNVLQLDNEGNIDMYSSLDKSIGFIRRKIMKLGFSVSDIERQERSSVRIASIVINNNYKCVVIGCESSKVMSLSLLGLNANQVYDSLVTVMVRDLNNLNSMIKEFRKSILKEVRLKDNMQ